MIRRISGSLLLLLAASTLCLVALEGAVRIFDLHGSNFIQFDAETGWTHRPGSRGTFVSDREDGVVADVTYNQFGLRGPETTLQKPAGMRRLLLLGDSFTESEQVVYDQTWGKLTEDYLNSGSRGWEVLNAGVAGYGTDNALLYLRNRGADFQPDAVLLLFFTGNDISDNDRELARKVGTWQRKPWFEWNGELVLHDYPLPPLSSGALSRLKSLIRDRSRLYLMVRDRLYKARAAGRVDGGATAIPEAWSVYRREAAPDWIRAWELTDELLGELQTECGEMGIPLFVATLPTGWRIDANSREKLLERYPQMADGKVWQFDLPDRKLSGILERRGVPHLDLTPILEEAARQSPERLYRDHLSPRGHEVVAAPIANFVLRHTSGQP